ncbi:MULTISPECIES: hypothetical protein [unclassified Shewanella]|uniref:hypothetical protein n=1 Tax=unclassified Shewanella TaxID=196818 RepID=UPI0021D919B3|nr:MULTISPECIES: hypothetical protein [unclassified Shewanella]MCU8060823.1 hypothetical protein [Shewanella sp. SM55]
MPNSLILADETRLIKARYDLATVLPLLYPSATPVMIGVPLANSPLFRSWLA